MILTDSAILSAMERGEIKIEPFERKHLNTNSVDLRIDNLLRVYSKFPLDPKSANPVETIEIPATGYVLQPNVLYLASTMEIAGTFKHHSQLKGKSSIARLGIFIDCTASWGDTGFCNHWTLEISVVHPVIIYPYMRICQIIFTEVTGDILMPYDKKPDSKYNGDNKAKESLYYKNYE
jgi:dCTP deaminase